MTPSKVLEARSKSLPSANPTSTLAQGTGTALLMMLALSCGGDEGTDLTGTWTGSFTQVAQERSGTIRLDLSQSGATLSGRWAITVPVDLTWEGRIEGSLAGSTVQARLLPDDRDICPYLWTATAEIGRLEGPYEAFDCRVEIIGRIDARRQ
ncbi:MAG TPA: hypothetical protein VLK65_00025 [Vicinamibacteria bacterium]|nr:hypothetical protein [Vicinamibacteria bacterium]